MRFSFFGTRYGAVWGAAGKVNGLWVKYYGVESERGFFGLVRIA